MKKIVIFFALTILILILVIIYISFYTKLNKEIKSVNTTTVTIDVSKFNLKNRTKLVLKEELLIGNNIKELENGYYDFKLTTKDNTVILTLNKLWYEEYGNDYIQDEYLAKICRELARCIKTTVENQELEYQIYKYIKDNYIKVKEGQDVEKINLEGICIWSNSIKNECIVYIKVE